MDYLLLAVLISHTCYSTDRLKAEAVFSAMDVRSNILQKREARRRELSVEMNQPIIKHEKVNPDLRNRLSRRNDWYS